MLFHGIPEPVYRGLEARDRLAFCAAAAPASQPATAAAGHSAHL